METVEVVIRINKDEYNFMKHFYAIKAFSGNYIAKQIVNGTVLSKGHGRLIDVENAKTKLCRVADRVPEPSKSCYIMSALYLDNTDEFPTVIEADREVNDE